MSISSMTRHMKHKHKDISKLTDIECLICNEMVHPTKLEAHNKDKHSEDENLEQVRMKVACDVCGKVVCKPPRSVCG